METTKSIPKTYQDNSLLDPTNLVSNIRTMDNTEKPRSIRFPEWLWDEIDRDAVRCKRSAVKQMEAVLAAYYRGDSFSLNLTRLAELGQNEKKISGKRQKVGVLKESAKS
jgi:hypothetical protein